MATDVKWIKIVVDIFDDEKMLLVESLPERDAIIVIWFKLLCLAGKQNNSGVFMFSDRIPYTDEMLSTIFRRPLNTVRLALKTFEEYGMIEIVDGTITIPKWEKHQHLDSYEMAKEQNRKRVEKYREKQRKIATKKGGNVTGNVTGNEKSGSVTLPVTYCNADRIRIRKEDIDRDIDREIEQTADKPQSTFPYQQIVSMFHQICVSYPKVTKLSDKRKKAISARLKTYTIDEIKTAFEKAERSSFLKGGNNRNWSANFDWIMSDGNMAKILDGNYDDKGTNNNAASFTPQPPTDDNYGGYMDFDPWAEMEQG